MKQSHAASLIESLVNIAVGLGLSLFFQATVLPLLGVPMPWRVNLTFAAVMTAVSIARSFTLRRLFEAMHIRRPLSPFMQAVVAERYRQIEIEGWSANHDDEHPPGCIAQAGGAYAIAAGQPRTNPPAIWPWADEWWKPRDFRRDLVRAGALILAEGERFDRNRNKRAALDGHGRP